MNYGVHEKKEKVSGIVKPDGRGKYNNHYKVTQEEEEKEKVIAQHISTPFLLLIEIIVGQKPIKIT